jgi:hypothetical protein
MTPDRMFPCRTVLAGSTTVVSCVDPELTQGIDVLLGALPDGDPGQPDRVEVRILRSFDGVGYEIWKGPDLLAGALSYESCQDVLLHHLNRWALEGDPSRLHLHAGLVEWSGAAALIVGPSGTGKSTLTAHLALSGWAYHSDEMVDIDLDHPCRAGGFTRPLTLKPGSEALLPKLWRERPPGSTDGRVYVSPNEFGPLRPTSRVPVTTVVFLSHDRSGPTEWVPLTVPEAVELLLADTLDAQRTGEDGIGALVGLASACHLRRFRGNSLPEAAARLKELVDLPGPRRNSPVKLPLADPGGRAWRSAEGPIGAAIRPEARIRRSDTAHGWLVDDGAVVYDSERGMLYRFKPVWAQVWRRLTGGPSLAGVATELGGGEEAVEAVCRFARVVSRCHIVELVDEL